MHELTIAKNIVNIVREQLTPEEEPRLRVITVRVGTLSTVVPELLQSGFEAAKDDTPIHRSKLDITVTPLRIMCNSCGKKAEIEPVEFTCPGCGSNEVKIISGTELTIGDLAISEN